MGAYFYAFDGARKLLNELGGRATFKTNIVTWCIRWVPDSDGYIISIKISLSPGGRGWYLKLTIAKFATFGLYWFHRLWGFQKPNVEIPPGKRHVKLKQVDFWRNRTIGPRTWPFYQGRAVFRPSILTWYTSIYAHSGSKHRIPPLLTIRDVNFRTDRNLQIPRLPKFHEIAVRVFLRNRHYKLGPVNLFDKTGPPGQGMPHFVRQFVRVGRIIYSRVSDPNQTLNFNSRCVFVWDFKVSHD